MRTLPTSHTLLPYLYSSIYYAIYGPDQLFSTSHYKKIKSPYCKWCQILGWILELFSILRYRSISRPDDQALGIKLHRQCAVFAFYRTLKFSSLFLVV